MSLFRPRKAPKSAPFDLSAQQPAVRRSICTGEMTVGYIDRATGRFHEIMLAPDRPSLEAFFRDRGVTMEEVRTIY